MGRELKEKFQRRVTFRQRQKNYDVKRSQKTSTHSNATGVEQKGAIHNDTKGKNKSVVRACIVGVRVRRDFRKFQFTMPAQF